MRLLIITQKVDKEDPILGFFHGWIAEFAKHFDSLIVICLMEGAHELPANVKVFSLGKEKGASRLKYVANFYKLIWSLRKEYDAVFVHMNQEYVLLGGMIWKLLGKRVGMWRNHHAGSIFTDIVMSACNMVFCTSKFSYTAKSNKIIFMPVGVDTELFKKDNTIQRISKSVLSLGRIAPSKRLILFVQCLGQMKVENEVFTGTIVGDPLPIHRQYADELVIRANELGLDNVKFEKGIPNSQTPRLYSSHEIFINLSSSGMYDKTIFEAMACECIVLASNENLRELIDDKFIFKDQDVAELQTKLIALLKMSDVDKSKLGLVFRNIVIEYHSLKKLAERLETEYSIHHESHKRAL